MLRLAERSRSVPQLRLAPKDQALLAKRGVPAAGAIAAMDVTPEVNVVVRPRDASEYTATLNTVALWQQAPVAPGARFEAAPGAAKALAQQDFIVQVPPSRLNELLHSLDRQAPGQVVAAVNFNVRDISQVQRMVTPADVPSPASDLQFAKEQAPPPEPSEALIRAETPRRGRGPAPAEPGTPKARRFAGARGEGGRIAGTPSRPRMGVPAKAKEAEEDQRVAAYRLREARDAEALQQLEALGYVGDSYVAEVDEEEQPADKKMAAAGQRQPRVEDVAAVLSARLKPPPAEDKARAVGQVSRDADAEAPPGLPSAARLVHDHAVEIGEQLGEICEIMLGVAFRADLAKKPPESPAPPPPSPPVTLRVTLLPPSAAVTTQPVPSAPRRETP